MDLRSSELCCSRAAVVQTGWREGRRNGMAERSVGRAEQAGAGAGTVPEGWRGFKQERCTVSSREGHGRRSHDSRVTGDPAKSSVAVTTQQRQMSASVGQWWRLQCAWGLGGSPLATGLLLSPVARCTPHCPQEEEPLPHPHSRAPSTAFPEGGDTLGTEADRQGLGISGPGCFLLLLPLMYLRETWPHPGPEL